MNFIEPSFKDCFRQDKSSEWELNKADVLVTLGDASILDEKYKQAIEDLQAAIEIMERNLSPHDRRIAEAFFQLGRAHNFSNEFEHAADAFRQAVEVFEKRLGKLNVYMQCSFLAYLEKEFENADDNKKPVLKRDLEDVASLIPDMESHVQDALSSAESFKLKQKEGPLLKSLPKQNPQSQAEEIPATDLTFLIRRKRRAESTVDEPKAKQSVDQHTENISN